MKVDVIILVLNEERFLRQCLESVLAFERPAGMEWTVWVVEGGSRDGTLKIAEEFADRYDCVQVLPNPKRIQSTGLNLAIRSSTADYVLRLDAHATYPKDYLRLCVETSIRTQADNVGGVVIALPGGNSYGARLVQALTTHRFGVGNAEFRLNPAEGMADTVPFGFFRRQVFDRLGYFDERLVRNQDYEFNGRIRASGGKVWLNPAIKVYYFNQPTLKAFIEKQLLKEGPYNPYQWFLAPYAVSFRHAASGIFALGICVGILFSGFTAVIRYPFLAVLGLYWLMGLIAGVQQAYRFREPRHVFAVPVGLFLFHFCHGLGLLAGMARLCLGIAPVQQVKEPWPGAGRFRGWPIPH